jgi:lysozyme family protein
MAVSRQESLAKVLAHEGGYSNNKKDPGGPTMKGVTYGSGRLSQRQGPVGAIRQTDHYL